MSKPTMDLVQIASGGGGIIIDASKPTVELVQIAAALSPKATLIIRNAGSKPTVEPVQIAGAAKGQVMFDL